MALLPAKCPECGGFVEVDNEKELGICQHCGQPFVVEKAIQTFNNYYNITTTYNTTNNYGDGAVVNVYEDKTKDFVIEGGVLKKYQGESLTPVVPEGVVAIEGGVFKNSTITKVTLPSTLKELRSCYDCGLNAPFSGCKYLEEVNLPEGLKEISINAFFDCISLTSIKIPSSVTQIGKTAFCNCTNLEKVYWNAKNVNDFSHDTSVFANAGTASSGIDFVFGNTVEKIPYYCCSSFGNLANIKSITIGNGVTNIGYGAFHNCPNLTEINVDNDNVCYLSLNGVLFNKDVTTLIQYPQGKSDSEYTIPNIVKTIEVNAFQGCKNLTVITLPYNVINIGAAAFYGCKGLTAITIPDSVINIGDGAFRSCDNLANLNISIDLLRKFRDAFPYELSMKIFNKSKGLCQHCGGRFSFFSQKCLNCGREKDY